MDTTGIIRAYYDQNAQGEWGRIQGRPEFLLTCRYLDRYIRPGDRVLDIGGGPGRYALYLAGRGCDVVLMDLSDGNVALAKAKAQELGLPLTALQGDARQADTLVKGQFDHVLLMGPLYHLLTDEDRMQATQAALACLRPGGLLYASFISMISGMIYAMKDEPAIVAEDPENPYLKAVLRGESLAGAMFTQAFFISQGEILPFFERFPLEKLHLFGQEGILSPCERNIFAQPEAVVAAWLDVAEALCEREELLSWSEHLMYIGKKLA